MNSEVAQLRQKIDQECRASWWALSAFSSGAARHQFIAARLRNMDKYHARLTALIGEDAATDALCEAFEPKEGEQ